MSKKKQSKANAFLYKLEAWLETPMFLLALLWLYFFILELFRDLTQTQQIIVGVIWVLFVVEYLIKIYLAERKWQYIKQNWITTIALIVPALRVFRLLRALSLLSSARVVSLGRFVRALTSTNRFIKDIKEAQGAPTREMNCGILIALNNPALAEEYKALSQAVSSLARDELIDATGIQWTFDFHERTPLADDAPKMPEEFVTQAGRAMAEGPYDMILVLTDVPLVSAKNKSVPGLASTVARMAIISIRKLQLTSKGKTNYPLDDGVLQLNAAALLLHLAGHISGLKESKDKKDVMYGFNFLPDRQELPSFSSEERQRLQKLAPKLPEHELRGGNLLSSFIFHVIMGIKHAGKVLRPLLRNRSFLLALVLPGLATAAVAPSLLLIFTAEIWDVGINMTNSTATLFAVLSVLFASFYLVHIQSLFLPKKEDYKLTEHLAVTNVVIYTSVLFACIGLFTLLGVLMLLIELFIFPDGLMITWLTIERSEVLLQDQIRLAVFISTVGTLTGALAGGLDRGSILKHLVLFRKKV